MRRSPKRGMADAKKGERWTRRWRQTRRWMWTVEEEVEVEAVEEGDEDKEVGVEEEVEADKDVEIRPSSSRFTANPLLPVIAEHWPPVGAWLR